MNHFNMQCVAFNVIAVTVLDLIIPRSVGQEPTVNLRQGTVVGAKIYPESFQTPVFAYLGIPYASAPIGQRRFLAPERHPGWNRTFFARNFGPNCPHLTDTGPINTQTASQDENCLFLNIWTPVLSDRYNKVPVLVFLADEEFAFPGPMIAGQEIAAEGIVVVSVNYRIGALGLLCLGSTNARGNLALLDQYMALVWVQDNIGQFGGDPTTVTLGGHAAAAAAVVLHMLSPRTKGLFVRAIMMSGAVTSPWTKARSSEQVVNASLEISADLVCPTEDSRATLKCLQDKSTQEILRSFEKQYKNGYWTNIVLPVVDSFLLPEDQYLPNDPIGSLIEGNFLNIPVLIGVTSSEAIENQWIDMSKQGFSHLLQYISSTAIPNILSHYEIDNEHNTLVSELIKWYYVNKAKDGDPWSLVEQLQTMYSEAKYDAPTMKQIGIMATKSQEPIYVYQFAYPGSVDLNGKMYNFSGAVHGTDLPYIFGPMMFQQLTRRRMNQVERRLMKRIKGLWINFIKFGNPTRERTFDAWRPFRDEDRYIQIIGGDLQSISNRASVESNNRLYLHRISFWNELLHTIKMLKDTSPKNKVIPDLQRSSEKSGVFRHTTYTLTGLVVALLTLLLVCVVLLRQRARELRAGAEF